MDERGAQRMSDSANMLNDDCSSGRLGYNHGCECKRITFADVDKVKSRNSSQYVLQAAKL